MRFYLYKQIINTILRNKNGYLYEIPLFFLAYFFICLFSVPVFIKIFHYVEVAIAAVMCFGLAIVIFLSKSISEPRLKFLKLPISIWIYLVLSVIAFLVIIDMPTEIMCSVILVFQAFASFWIDLRISHYLNERIKARE